MHRLTSRRYRYVGLVAATLLAGLVCPRTTKAQIIEQEVAGVSANTEGILKNVEIDRLRVLQRARQAAMQPAAGEMAAASKLRKISLRKLEAAIERELNGGTRLSDEMRYLAGLQRIQYVFVYPDQHDIVLAGPGEGWKINEQGETVGVTTGWPVMLLDDLLVALRHAETSRRVGISCSIDPTADGLVRLRKLAGELKTIGNPQSTAANIENTLGLQNISVTGIPRESHFAHVIVAADYKMKRLAMNFDEAPVRGMPSYLDMMRGGGRGMQSMLPRWWLAPAYNAMLTDESGLSWELRGAAVKTLSEEDYVTETGQREHTGKSGGLSRKWADNMTAHYEELAKADAVFGQLRNCIDLAIVAALISKERLTEKAAYSMPLLLDDARITSLRFNAPTHVPSQASVLKKGRNWIISASGGVQLDPESIVTKRETAVLAPVRAEAAAKGERWWWN